MKTDQILFRNTAAARGRRIMIRPDNTPLQFLSCGRIILNRESGASASSDGSEVALICVQGSGRVLVGSTLFPMSRYDAIYIPPGKTYQVEADDGVDLVECSAPSEADTETQMVPFESVQNDPVLHLTAGGENSTREVYRLIDANVQASRLVCGLTLGQPGHWTSWSPHEHAATREEVYLYIDMPPPAFGIQMIYDDLRSPDFVQPVFQDDAVVITR